MILLRATLCKEHHDMRRVKLNFDVVSCIDDDHSWFDGVQAEWGSLPLKNQDFWKHPSRDIERLFPIWIRPSEFIGRLAIVGANYILISAMSAWRVFEVPPHLLRLIPFPSLCETHFFWTLFFCCSHTQKKSWTTTEGREVFQQEETGWLSSRMKIHPVWVR